MQAKNKLLITAAVVGSAAVGIIYLDKKGTFDGIKGLFNTVATIPQTVVNVVDKTVKSGSELVQHQQDNWDKATETAADGNVAKAAVKIIDEPAGSFSSQYDRVTKDLGNGNFASAAANAFNQQDWYSGVSKDLGDKGQTLIKGVQGLLGIH